MKKKSVNFKVVFLMIMLLVSLCGCGKDEENLDGAVNGVDSSNDKKTEVSFAGHYEGSASTYHGMLSLVTELNAEGEIVNIEVGEHQDTEGVGTLAIAKVVDRIVENQSLDVDSISGATISSDAVMNAVANSLELANLDPREYGYTEKMREEDYPLPIIDKEKMPKVVEKTHSITVTDVKGRKVTIDLPISSYAISTMDVIEYIIPLKGEEAFEMLVGSGQDGGHGLNKYAELYTPVVGNYMEHVGQISDHNAPFDLEMILSMNPDVLIVNSAMAAHKYAMQVEDQLAQAGIKIVLIDVPGKELEHAAQDTVTLLGQIFEVEERAAEVTSFLDNQYGLIASKNLMNRTDKPTVYYEKSGYSEVYGSTSTSKRGWGTVINLAGGENIADRLLLETAAANGSSSQLDPEYVLETDPDFIMLSDINDGWLDITKEPKMPVFDILNRVGWKDLKAVENKDVYEFAHSTSRQIYAFYPTLKMAKLMYPQEFAEVDPEIVLDEFFNRFMILDTDISTWFVQIN